NNILKNCLLSAAAQLHRPLSWLCFQMYALLLLQLMDHRKQVTRLGIPFRPEHPYETHARLLLGSFSLSLACETTFFKCLYKIVESLICLFCILWKKSCSCLYNPLMTASTT